jgi:catechol 2,3-dioxygenase-like lactoylglutathione lyase family enzyme
MPTAQVDKTAVAAFETGIVVRNVEPMFAFYRHVLGFEPYGEVSLPGIHVRGLCLGNSILKLTYFSDVAEGVTQSGLPPGLRYITLRVTNIKALYEHCLAHGCGVVLALEECTSIQGVTYQHSVLTDPEGNYVEFVQGMPYAPPSDDFRAGRVGND